MRLFLQNERSHLSFQQESIISVQIHVRTAAGWQPYDVKAGFVVCLFSKDYLLNTQDGLCVV